MRLFAFFFNLIFGLTVVSSCQPANSEKEISDSSYVNSQGLLLGSDAPQVFNLPGFSIHHEWDGMIRAGLSPLKAIQIGTLDPAKFFNGNFGQIKKGLNADLILLENNPLEDIKNLQNPLGVMARGQWIDRITIDKKLKEIAKLYSST